MSMRMNMMMEVEVEEEEEEIEHVFVAHEIDLDYEFDAARFFDFTRPETPAEAQRAELWFENAPSYPPSCVSSSSLLLLLFFLILNFFKYINFLFRSVLASS